MSGGGGGEWAVHVCLCEPCNSMSFIATEQYRKSLDVMMQLRKIANHPLLIRHVYEDGKLRQMSQDILKVL